MGAFLPVSGVDRYLAFGFLKAFLVVLAVIVILLQTLDLMNRAEEILAADGAGAPQLLLYIGWRAPQLADRFIPFVALIAALITLARLGQTSEITAMRAAGMSPIRVLAPVCATGALIGLVHFAMHELVVVDAYERLDRWESQDYALPLGPPQDVDENVRVAQGDQVVRADALRLTGGVWRLENLRAYTLGPGGISGVVRAESATHNGTNWSLIDAMRFGGAESEWTDIGDAAWPEGPSPSVLTAAAMDPDHAHIGELARATSTMDETTRGAPRLETALIHRFAGPASSMIMPLLASLAGFGLHRSNTLLIRIGAGLALGFAYFVIDNFMIVMGRLDAAPALLCVMTAPVLFLAVGLSMRR